MPHISQTPKTDQQDVFLYQLVNTQRNLALRARAGTGKTTTIRMGVYEYAQKFPQAEIAVYAYNAAIAKEVGEKLKEDGHTNWKTVQSATMHSAGFSLIKSVFKPVLEEKKVYHIVDARAKDFRRNDKRVYDEYASQIAQLVSLAKQHAFGFFSDVPISSVDAWFTLADKYDVNGLDDMQDMERVVEAAQSVYVESLEDTRTIDFDDMILFPLIKNIRCKWGKDLVFIDEAQDLSRARQALARKMVKVTGRMIIVGDDCQAIYGFTGADSEAMDNLIDSMDADVLPLSVTWRCPKAVVALAQGLVPDIVAAPSALDGVVRAMSFYDKDGKTDPTVLQQFLPTDVILCRVNAPLITMAYALIRAKVACKVEGRQIGTGLAKLASRWKVQDIDQLLDKLDEYQDREVQKAKAKGNDQKVAEVQDRCDTLREICSAVVAEKKTQLSDVLEFINNLFGDNVSNVLTLASYHKSKGREWERVFLLEHAERCPSKWARQVWQQTQEKNLAYVAYTRAMKELVFLG